MCVNVDVQTVFHTQFVPNFVHLAALVWGMRWPSWLRHCTTSSKVAGSIPDGVIGIFH